MSCCIGIALFGDNNNQSKNCNNDAYIKKSNIKPLNAPELYQISVKGMSKTDTMRVPPLPLTSRDSPLKIVSKTPQDICYHNDYHSRKTSSPTSSAENFHFKTSSSDSSTSRDEIPEISTATHVRIRPSTAIAARTCFNFVANNKDEISFKRGSKVIVKSKHSIDDEYVLIQVNEKEGYAPKRFLQPCGSAPPFINNSELTKAQTLIGAGTFAKVYEVLYGGQKYALKEYIHQDLPKAQEEAECLNAMDHKNIVKVFGLCLSPAALLLEYCEGGQLSKLINPDCNPPLRVLLTWTIQIAEGLWYMHNREIPICHADIKPQNCLILEKPCTCDPNYYRNEDSNLCSICGFHRLSRLTLKLTDFGLSKPTQTARVSLSGSVPYMAPEYIRETVITPKADVWSFGVLLWEILAKQTPYSDIQQYGLSAIMFGIGQEQIHLPLSDSWPLELQDLLNACWESNVEKRLNMEEVIEKLREIPTTNPDYVLVGSVKKPTESNLSIMETLKQYLHKKNGLISDVLKKPKAPPRKLSKHDIGSPQDMKTIISVQNKNGHLEIHDHEEDRKRHLSTHDNGGTLPRETSRRGGLGTAISTPELHNIGTDHSKTLERKPAMRRKPNNYRVPDPINRPTKTFLGSTTPCHDDGTLISNNFDENTVEVIIKPEDIRVPRKSRESQKSVQSSHRSPSSHSQSTFYVSHNDLISTPTYDSFTLTSQSSVDSESIPPKKRGIIGKFFKSNSKHKEAASNSFANPDFVYYNYSKHKTNGNYLVNGETEVHLLSPLHHLQTVNLAQFIKPILNDTPTTSHFVKLPNNSKNQRQQKLGEHRRNTSNASERTSSLLNNNNNYIVTPTSSTGGPKSPSFHHSSSEGASIASPHLSVSNYSPSRSSAINFGLEIPLPPPSSSSPTTFPITNDEPFTQRDHRSRANTTATHLLMENIPAEPSAPPILHPRSRSTDVSTYNQDMLNSLTNRFTKNGDQTIIENIAYYKLQTDSKPIISPSPSTVAPIDSQPHYMALKSTSLLPIQQHRRQKSADIIIADTPPLPPPHTPSQNMLNTVVELPKSKAPPPPPRTLPPCQTPQLTSASSSSGYLVLESTPPRSNQPSPSSSSSMTTNPHYNETKSSPRRLSDEIPQSKAPPRPDTLPNRPRIERNNDGYVDISGQNKVPRIIPRHMHNRRN